MGSSTRPPNRKIKIGHSVTFHSESLSSWGLTSEAISPLLNFLLFLLGVVVLMGWAVLREFTPLLVPSASWINCKFEIKSVVVDFGIRFSFQILIPNIWNNGSVENIRQWCTNASTGTHGFPPGPAPSTGIRLLIGAKLFCLANEVRWRQGVTGKFWNLEVWEEGQRGKPNSKSNPLERRTSIFFLFGLFFVKKKSILEKNSDSNSR